MKTKLLVVAVLVLVCIGICPANPLPPKMVAYINVDPPQIGIWSFEASNMSGQTITTSQCTATINNGVVIPENFGAEPFILDSSNTSGFIICSESDYVEVDDELYCEGVSFGQYRWYPAPIPGHSIKRYHYYDWDMPSYVMCFEDAEPGYAETDVIINEINAHGTWGVKSNFIELYNTSDQAVDIGGWRIVVDDIYQLPDNAVIPAHGFYAVNCELFPENFGLTASADNVYLIKSVDPDNYMVVDQVGWSSDHGENVAFMRYPDGDTHYDHPWWYAAFQGYNDQSSSTFENGFPSRGAANRHDCPGFVVIGVQADSIGDGIASIHWTDPIWDEQFSHSVLVASSETYPETPADGEIIYSGTQQQFTDNYVPPSSAVFYTVFAYNLSGEYSTPTNESKTYIWFGSAGIDDPALPTKISSLSSYPNPFNARTTISFSLESQSQVGISIYDITGRLVDVLISRTYDAGNHSLIWDAGNQPSGIYFARLSAGEFVSTTRMALLK